MVKKMMPQSGEKAEFIREEKLRQLLSEESDTRLDELRAVIEKARQVKLKIYGKRLVLFAPLYISNFCINNCTYCGYRSGNFFTRGKLSTKELAEEVKILENLGHKRLALEAGEHPL